MTSNEAITFQVDHLAREGHILSRHVEILLKYLLLVNGHIPHGYEDLRKQCSQNSTQSDFTKRARRFLTSADELFSGLAVSICSCFVTEVVLVFGGTVYTPQFTVTIQLPNKYDPDGCASEWSELADPSGFPIQLVQNFHRLSRAFDSPPSNVWLLIRVDESKVKNVPPSFRIDRRASISQKGHHLRISFDPQANLATPAQNADCSGFYPLSPIPTSVREFLSTSGLDMSGIMPMSPGVFARSYCNKPPQTNSPEHDVTVSKQSDLSTVYFTFVHRLKGFRS